jgi:hypothetical protein
MHRTPASIHPVIDPSGELCDVNQIGPVWFLAGTFNAHAERLTTDHCPTGRAGQRLVCDPFLDIGHYQFLEPLSRGDHTLASPPSSTTSASTSTSATSSTSSSRPI